MCVCGAHSRALFFVLDLSLCGNDPLAIWGLCLRYLTPRAHNPRLSFRIVIVTDASNLVGAISG